ncbi:MAG: PEP-CTERM system histidine kinase PrsK, partial [Nitrospirota bacterium]|nr:PEP-CTERM system histidine kinase PrsK [Nitrospirota bacterium]
ISVITIVLLILVAVVVIFKRRPRLPDIAFVMGLLSTAAVISGDSMSILQPDLFNKWKRLVLASEVLMAPSWLLFTLSYAREEYRNNISMLYRLLVLLPPAFLVYLVSLPVASFFYAPEFKAEGILFLETPGYVLNLSLLLYSILAIINLEATLRSSSGVKRWHIKYVLIGVGGVLAVNIFYYSHALLYRSINMNLLPVRTSVILVSMLIAGFSLFKGKVMDIEVLVSRKVVYRSVSIFIVGLYLLGLGVIGEGMRYFGPKAGKNITTFLGFAGAIAVISIIFSEQLRRRVIVYINKHFYRTKYDYREQWLNFTRRISLKHSFEELVYSIAEGFKDAMGVKGASIWLKEKGNGEYVCLKAVDTVTIDIEPKKELTEFLRDRKWILDVHDDKCRHVIAENSEFIERHMVSLIVPLLNVDELLGFIILREDLADTDYNFEDYDLLKTLAGQATTAILNSRMSQELTEAKEMEAIGRVSSFIMHDLKNTASMLSMIVQNAEEHLDNPEFQKDAIRAVSNTSEKIKVIIGKLKNLPQKMTLNLQYADLVPCVSTAIRELDHNGDCTLSFNEPGPLMVKFDMEEITKVVVNLVINALDATDNRGKVEIALERENEMAVIRVSDDGPGMSDEFIEHRLFKPFQTTKKNGLGIGLYQCKTIVEAHSGKIKVKSSEGGGTEFSVYIPLSV